MTRRTYFRSLRLFATACLLLTVLLGADECDPTDTCDGAAIPPSPGPGASALQNCAIAMPTGERRYQISFPDGLDPAKPVPLVVELHGAGGSIDNFFSFLPVQVPSFGEPVVRVRPQAKGAFNSWNAQFQIPGVLGSTEDDIGFIREIVENISERVRIDPDRIYAVGHSHGGSMAHRLACDAADLFRGVASIAFPFAGEATGCRPARPVSVFTFQSTGDQVMWYNGGFPPGLPAAPQAATRMAAAHGCIGRPVREFLPSFEPLPDAERSYCDTWLDCAGDEQVKFCTRIGGIHTSVSGFPLEDFNAGTLWWNFLDGSSTAVAAVR